MEFYQTYESEIIYAAITIGVVVALYIATTFLFNRVIARTKRRFPGESTGSFQLIKRILNALWIVLGSFKMYYLLTPEDSYTYLALEKDFKLIVYLSLVAVATIVGAASANIWFKRTISRKKLDNSDTTSLRFLRYVMLVTIYTVGVLLAILAFPSLRVIGQTALGGAGVLAVIVAISSQEALANVVSGLFIISFKPFKVGDLIELVGTMEGVVTDITLRHTVIRNFDNKMIVIPNAIINKEKLVNANLGDSKCCERIEIGISYDSDIDLAKKIMREECENHKLIIDNRTEQEIKNGSPQIKIAIINLGDFSVTMRAWAWVEKPQHTYEVRWDIYESVKKRFDKEGIEIPFPYQNVVLKKDKN
jgi:small-conductance mechanosensitive channel